MYATPMSILDDSSGSALGKPYVILTAAIALGSIFS